MKPFTLIVPAGGTGSRSGASLPKQYVELCGAPMLRHTLERFAAMPECAEMIVAVGHADLERAREAAAGFARLTLVEGGATRQHSIANALGWIRSKADIVLVHDAARPCVSQSLIRRVAAAAAEHGAAIPVMPIAETVKRIDERGRVIETLDRSELRAVQTPQGFDHDLLQRAYAHAAEHGIGATDDASLVEAIGEPVVAVDGEASNIKVTVAEDFAVAERWLGRGGG